MNHKHLCPLCGKKFKCVSTFDHSGTQAGEVITCQGDYESFCDNHDIDEYQAWLILHGMLDIKEQYDAVTVKVFGDNGVYV